MVANPRYDEDLAKINRLATSLTRFTKASIGEILFFISFAVNFILGKIIHLYSSEEEVYNYYNNKRNIFNQIFVKRGWGWTTVAIVILYGIAVVKNNRRETNGRLVVGALIRYIIATVWWVFFTQWCFGLPIMDKIFIFTGGKCVSNEPQHWSLGFVETNGRWESASTSLYGCRRVRGSWEGGHDPSGHVFLLVHLSLYLFQEIQPFWRGWLHLKSGLAVIRPPQLAEKVSSLVKETPYVFAVFLMVLWWFMLLVTNMYFHSLAEKAVGLIFGYIGVLTVYYIPRWT